MDLRILILPVDTFDRVDDAERIKGKEFNSIEEIEEELGSKQFEWFTISDMAYLYNNTESIAESWMTYIYLI